MGFYADYQPDGNHLCAQLSPIRPCTDISIICWFCLLGLMGVIFGALHMVWMYTMTIAYSFCMVASAPIHQEENFMWIDTHVHFDAAEFDATRANDWVRARDAGVSAQIIPAVSPANFETVRTQSSQFPNTFYALGIHPMYVMDLPQAASIELLRSAVVHSMNDPKFVAIGEIGLDGFVPELDWDTQVWFLRAQLNIAREFDLPVLLHVRRSVDKVSKYLREFNIQKGIAHAFNGSFTQARVYTDMGLHLGFGGTMTFERARQIRRLASELPLSSLVIETDAPDIPPAWLNAGAHNYSHHLPRIAHTLAKLRGLSHEALAQSLWQNTLNALPRLAQVLPADI